MESVIGKIIDNYKILEEIGVGGQGVVYKAFHMTLERPVALKRLLPELYSDQYFLKRFQNEAKILARLENQNIVRVLDFRLTEIGWIIVMEYVDGISLAEKIKSSGPLPYEAALLVSEQILLAISHAHQAGVIHRDIKPKNIMLTMDGTVKVTDFGVAKIHLDPLSPETSGNIEATATRLNVGTLPYMAPELLKGEKKIDYYRSDIYSIGMTFYEMVAGKRPFQQTDTHYTIVKSIIEEKFPAPDKFNPAIPREYVQLVMKALEKSPHARFKATEEMLNLIKTFKKDKKSEEILKTFVQTKSSLKQSSHKPVNLKSYWLVGLPVLAALLVLLVFLVPGWRNRIIRSTNGVFNKNAVISINSVPEGANIFINDDSVGITPVTNLSWPVGSVSLYLRKDDYFRSDTNFVLAANTNTSINLVLKKRPALPELGTILITSQPAGANVWIDGINVGKTPYRGDELAEELHTIKVGLPGYRPRVRHNYQIKVNAKDSLHLVLEPILEQATLVLRVIPEGIISVNGQNSSHTGETVSFFVEPGSHHLSFQHPDYGSKELTVSLAANQTKTLTCYFESYVNIQALTENGELTWGTISINGQNIDQQAPIARYALGIGEYKIIVVRTGYETIESEKSLVIRPVFEETVHNLVFHLKEN